MSAVDERTGTATGLQTRPYREVRKGYTYFEEGDVLFAKITPCMENGKAAIAQRLPDRIGFGSTEFHVLRPGSSVTAEWVWFFVRREEFRKRAREAFRGAVGQQRVPQDFLAAQSVALPPVEEQRRIVARIEELMGRIREARRLREEAKKDTDRLMQAALAEVFPRLDSSRPAGWRWVELEHVFDFQQGASMFPKRREGRNPKPFLRTKNVLWGSVDVSTVDEMDFTDSEVERLRLVPGDLLVCEGGDVGRTAIWRGELPLCLYQNHLHRLRPKIADVESGFFLYWMNAAYRVFALYQGAESRTAIPNLSGSRLKTFVAPLPPLGEQRRIVAHLDQVQQKGSSLKQAQDGTDAELRRLEQAILDRAFRGDL
jgi:type I restriction enzyme S subunit